MTTPQERPVTSVPRHPLGMSADHLRTRVLETHDGTQREVVVGTDDLVRWMHGLSRSVQVVDGGQLGADRTVHDEWAARRRRHKRMGAGGFGLVLADLPAVLASGTSHPVQMAACLGVTAVGALLGSWGTQSAFHFDMVKEPHPRNWATTLDISNDEDVVLLHPATSSLATALLRSWIEGGHDDLVACIDEVLASQEIEARATSALQHGGDDEVQAAREALADIAARTTQVRHATNQLEDQRRALAIGADSRATSQELAEAEAAARARELRAQVTGLQHLRT